MPDEVERILGLLNAAKSNPEWMDRNGFVAGYHTIELDGQRYRGQRDPAALLAMLPLDLTGKIVLDLGCNTGGMLHALADTIAMGLGVDKGTASIEAAEAIKEHQDHVHLRFQTFDLDEDDLETLSGQLRGGRADAILFLTLPLRVLRWSEALAWCAEHTSTLVFEAQGTVEQQLEQLIVATSHFPRLELVSGHSDGDFARRGRSLWVCRSEEVPTGPLEAKSLLAELRRRAPDLDGKTIREVAGGARSSLFIVDERWIVKVAHPGHEAMGRVDGQMARLVADRTSLPVPMTRTFEFDGRVVSLAEVLPGLQAHTIPELALEGDAKAERFVDDLADIMAALHDLALEDLVQGGVVPLAAPLVDASQIQVAFRLSLDSELRAVLDRASSVLARAPVHDRGPDVVGHFDLRGSKVLADPATGEITAVLGYAKARRAPLFQEFVPVAVSFPGQAPALISRYEALTGVTVSVDVVLAGALVHAFCGAQALWEKRAAEEVYLAPVQRLRLALAELGALPEQVAAPPETSSIPEGWRSWAAENMVRGVSAERIIKVLERNGFARADIEHELSVANSHPYVAMASRLMDTIRRREWLLESQARMWLAWEDRRTLDRRPCPPLDDFLRDYVTLNQPGLFTGGLDDWSALRRWSPRMFKQLCGEVEVEVQSVRDAELTYEERANRPKQIGTMAQFVDEVISRPPPNDLYLNVNNANFARSSLAPLFKDVGTLAADDWLDRSDPKREHLWFGPAGIRTALRHDLTHTTFVQIYGRRRFWLIHPGQVVDLYNEDGVFSKVDGFAPQLAKHPRFRRVKEIAIDLHPGEALFVPVGWWYRAEALDVSIGLSFTRYRGQAVEVEQAYPRPPG